MTKLMKRIIAGTMAFVCFATVGISAAATNDFGAFAPQDNPQAVVPQAPIDNGGMEMGDVVETSGMELKVQRLSATYTGTNADAGIATVAEDAYTLTATVLPADAADKTVTYTAAWSNANSTWATGKNVNDYVTVAQGTAGSLTATVTCQQAFGEPIVVTVTSNDNPDAKASATLHYKQKVQFYKMLDEFGFISTTMDYTEYGNGTDVLDSEMVVDFENEDYGGSSLDFYVERTSVYTRNNPVALSNVTMKPTTEFAALLTSFGAPTVINYEGNGFIYNVELLTKPWFETYGTTNAKKNQIINALLAFEGVAYTVTVTDTEGGSASFNISLDTSALSGQKRVESVTLNNVELEF
ncbi:MAG: hypothetical protein J6B55_03675 [Clostridia bacterium]|nr:hypothetical protein [Clostridia bacterium]